MNLVEANESDFEFARKVHHSAYRAMVERRSGDWVEAVQDDFFRASWHRHSHCIIRIEEEPVGYCAIERSAQEIILRELAILPERQGQGTGSGILKELIIEGEKRGIPVKLNVMKTNRGAKRLYERLGFLQHGETDTHYTLIRKQLSQVGAD